MIPSDNVTICSVVPVYGFSSTNLLKVVSGSVTSVTYGSLWSGHCTGLCRDFIERKTIHKGTTSTTLRREIVYSIGVVKEGHPSNEREDGSGLEFGF